MHLPSAAMLAAYHTQPTPRFRRWHGGGRLQRDVNTVVRSASNVTPTRALANSRGRSNGRGGATPQSPPHPPFLLAVLTARH